MREVVRAQMEKLLEPEQRKLFRRSRLRSCPLRFGPSRCRSRAYRLDQPLT